MMEARGKPQIFHGVPTTNLSPSSWNSSVKLLQTVGLFTLPCDKVRGTASALAEQMSVTNSTPLLRERTLYFAPFPVSFPTTDRIYGGHSGGDRVSKLTAISSPTPKGIQDCLRHGLEVAVPLVPLHTALANPAGFSM